MKWYTRSWERPRKRSASEALPSSVSNRYSLSIRTHGSSCRRRASSSPRRVCSFSASSNSSRAASHSSRVPVGWSVILSLLVGCTDRIIVNMAIAAPPGPRERIPGMTMLSFWRDPPNFLVSLAREHGDVARFRWGRSDEYLLNHPDYVHRVLVTEQGSFMKGQALQEAKRMLGEGLLTSEGDLHLRQRRLMQPLFHRRQIAAYGEQMIECAERVEARWRDGDTLDVHGEKTRLTLDVVGRTLFAADVEGEAA